VLKKATPDHRIRIASEDAMYVLATEKQQILHYEVVDPYPAKAKLTFDIDLLKKRAEVELNNGLLDCQVDICSPEVILPPCILATYS
jgi:translation initiation factor eIF-2B subunit epsilon